jgi:predicted AAA+ superfamily ATPase
MQRIIENYLFDPELTAGKMIFLTGPRQVGKTTFALNWLDRTTGSRATYFNWDDPAVMSQYRKNPLFFRNIIDEAYNGKPVPAVFDEIHKQKGWKNLLKGVYDTGKERMTLLVTGSARLGLYRKSGDSLVGRYFLFQMLPAGLPELADEFSFVLGDDRSIADGRLLLERGRKVKIDRYADAFERLLRFGGFPEPLLRASPRFLNRWQQNYRTLLTREDVRDMSRIADIRGLEHLVTLLPSKVGSLLSVNSLSEDLNYNHRTIANWIEMLKEIYLVFTIRPWQRNVIRAIKKEPKLYFYDWSVLDDPGARFENMTAVTLLRMAARFTEMGLGRFEVAYIRDKEKREVDFVLVKDNAPMALFEAKTGDAVDMGSGRRFSAMLGVPFFGISAKGKKPEAFPDNCFSMPATMFFMLAG